MKYYSFSYPVKLFLFHPKNPPIFNFLPLYQAYFLLKNRRMLSGDPYRHFSG
jgi:hypothetical protein